MVVNSTKDSEVLLAKLKFFKGCKVAAYRCDTCKIQLIDEKECNRS